MGLVLGESLLMTVVFGGLGQDDLSRSFLVERFQPQPGARYDPQNLTLLVRNRVYRPLGIVPFTPRFTSQQLEVREQVSAIYLFEESIPVTDDFSPVSQRIVSKAWGPPPRSVVWGRAGSKRQ